MVYLENQLYASPTVTHGEHIRRTIRTVSLIQTSLSWFLSLA